MTRALPLLVLALFACKDSKDEPSTDSVPGDDSPGEVDLDGDGSPAPEDCDDQNAAVHPGADEVCNGVDDDCDGTADVDATDATTWYADADQDGHGDAATGQAACEQPSGTVATGDDCNDTDNTVYPGAGERCDGIDNDCNGAVDDNIQTTWYADTDGDNHGDPNSALEDCDPPEGYASTPTDCDDQNAAINPDAPELCNGLDDDCDGAIDDEATDAATWYQDADQDGYGSDDFTQTACEQPTGYAASGGDCDEANADIHPDATELCNGLDDDCDSLTDEEGADGATWYADADSDGYGDPNTSTTACSQPSGYGADASDCDDQDAAVNPAASELCDGLDNDCDTSVDEEALDGATWYADADSDGYGDPDASTTACSQPSGYGADASDCDDADPAVNPAATETCDSIDNNCDGTIDEDTAADASTWYADTDNDVYGDPNSTLQACSRPTGYRGNSRDCDDTDPNINPAESEVCNGIDDDCDNVVDDNATDATMLYPDADCDGYGDPNAGILSCSALSGYGTDDGDCDDTDPRTNPARDEICDSADNDCNNSVDDSCATPTEVSLPTYGPVESPAHGAACALLGELSTSANPHVSSNLGTYMSILEGSASGLAASVEMDADPLDWSIRNGSSYTASIGNYSSSTNPWPTLTSTSSSGAGRFRGYFNIGCGDELNYTIGLIGNDSLDLTIEGTTIMTVNWNDGQWKKFRYVSFPEPGLYAFEVRWSTNLCCNIDPFELVWSPGFVSGYDNYDTMCASSSCTYGDGVAIPGFTVVDGTALVQSTDGSATACAQCATDADCSSGEVCNTAGICE